jgi:SSS family solute:Na+ symporter
MLSIYDYIVIGFYFVFMTVIGWVCRKFIRNTSDYFRGGGQMLWWMAGSSAFMVSFSAWTFTGAASKAYEDGSVIMVLFFANALGFLFNFLYFAPRFRQTRVVTSMEAVRMRFGKGNEQFFTWLQIPLGILYAGIWLNGLSVFIAAAFNVDLDWTIIITGGVVLIMAVIGGAWAVVAGDFMQMLILMPVTIVAAFLAIAQVGGLDGFVAKLPRHHLNWGEGARVEVLYLWIVALVIKQFISTNNLLEASRYLNVKDSHHARKAALLGTVLFLIGPIVWFVPPMAASITHPDLHLQFPNLAKPAEGAFVAICMVTMPAGMIGLLISGIFAATMSSMDAGLNRNAGFFVKNFYQVVLRPHAAERELLLVSKGVTLVMGLLVIVASLMFSRWKNLGLFDLMLRFGALIALPYSVPLIWGTLIKRAPAWAGWSTVLVGFACSWLGEHFLTAAWAQRFMGWTNPPLSPREQSDWVLLVGVLLNFIVCSGWFFATCALAHRRPAAERERVEAFFARLNRPVDFEREEGAGNDAQQCRTLGLMCLIYGAFLSLLVLIPNSVGGRVSLFFCAGSIAGVGGWLYWHARRVEAKAAKTSEPSPEETKPVWDNLKESAR